MVLSHETAAESGFARTLLNGEFAITAELVPPASGAPDELLALAEPFRGLVDALNVTDGPRAMVHMSALAGAAILDRAGIEPILQFTCRDRNRIALQADLLGASAVGVRNVLILRGDEPDPAEIPPPKPVFDVDSRDLIQLAARMRAGEAFASGREIATPPRLFIGAADTPVDPEPGWRPTGLTRKIEAGAGFVQTQLCWDIDVVRRYARALEEAGITDRAFLLIGIGPIASARSARWMRDNLWGVQIPDPIIERLERAADPKAEGIAICAELIRELAGVRGVSGVHLMAPVGLSAIPLAIRESGVLENRAEAV
ncbi:MAG: methylenetetrahydrofolate reductase [Defluviicoccus sp.]|nr:methylenetetrahydrofolate reductase [Defluviicoccus sp.]